MCDKLARGESLKDMALIGKEPILETTRQHCNKSKGLSKAHFADKCIAVQLIELIDNIK